MHDDSALLRAYVSERSESAFAELVRRQVDAVYSCALRCVGGDRHLAEDVTQQVFVMLARKAGALLRHPHLTGWLHVTTRNEAANVVRRERRRKQREQEAHAMNENSSEPAADAEWSGVAPVLDDAIQHLANTERTVVLLRFIDQRSFAEIGTALGISEDAARMRLGRALDKLRAQLGCRGVVSTAEALGVALAKHAIAAAPAGLAEAATGAALANAGGSALVGLRLIELMTSTKVIAGAVALVVVGAMATSMRETQTLREAEDGVVTSRDANQLLTNKIAATRQRAAAVEQSEADLGTAIDQAKSAPAAGKVARTAPDASRAAARPTSESMAAGRDFVARHPEVRQAVLDYHHAQMTKIFGPLYRDLGFSDEQIARFEAANRGSAGVFRMITDADGHLILVSTPEFGDPDKRREEEAQIVNLLGQEGIRKAQLYKAQIPARMLAAQLAGDLYYTSTPLSYAQAEQFVATVASGGRALPNGNYDWDTINARAATILGEPQLDALHAIQAKRQFDLALAEAMRRNSASNQTATVVSPKP